MALYKINEQAAVERLIAEEFAADVYQHLMSSRLPGYAGAWFNVDSGKLAVATNNPENMMAIRQLGAEPALVEWSLSELEAIGASILSAALHFNEDIHIQSIHIDFPRNRLKIGVLPGQLGNLTRLPEAAHSAVLIEETDIRPMFASGPVRGADGYRHYEWGTTSNCSIGAATSQGFLTAGHCVSPEFPVRSWSNQPLGEVMFGTFTEEAWGNRDVAWVETHAGWIPQAKINGYDDGEISVPAKWSGTRESPLYSTVCRYGRTTGGPHCGEVTAVNVTRNWGYDEAPHYIYQLNEITYSCVENGDSGGPFLSAAGNQIQGITVGGNPHGCPASVPADTKVWFQRMAIVIQYAIAGLSVEKPVLTAHGANTPTVHGLNCSQTSPSSYFCTLDYYNSQGSTTLNWSSTGGGSGSGTLYTGYCAPSSSVTVSVTASNPYGTGAPLSRHVHCHPIVP